MLNFLRQLLKFNTSHLFGCHYWNRNYLSIRKHPSLSPLLHVLVCSVLFSCQIICFYVCKTVLWRTYYSSVKKMFCFFHSHVFGMGFMLKIANCIKWLNTEFWSLTSKYIENRCIPHTCNKHILIIIHIYIASTIFSPMSYQQLGGFGHHYLIWPHTIYPWNIFKHIAMFIFSHDSTISPSLGYSIFKGIWHTLTAHTHFERML